jgi:hypothetical protein
MPNLATITVAAIPRGSVFSFPSITFQDRAALDTFRCQFSENPHGAVTWTIGAATWAFVSWSDGGAAGTPSPPSTATTYTATYQCVAGCVRVVALRQPDLDHTARLMDVHRLRGRLRRRAGAATLRNTAKLHQLDPSLRSEQPARNHGG